MTQEAKLKANAVTAILLNTDCSLADLLN